MKKLPLNLVRGAALAVAAITPWLYGGTLDWTIELISNVLLMLMGGAVLGWSVAWRMPKLGWVLPVTLALLGLGWTAAMNPRGIFDEMLMLVFPLEDGEWNPWLPSSVDGPKAVWAMRRLTGLIGLLWIMRDMAGESRWRQGIVWTVAMTGLSVAMHGILGKTSGDVWGYWGRSGAAFAGFWYHANAASFLNLTWPFVVVLTLDSFARGKNHLKRALLLGGTLMMIAAMLINVSKAGHLLFLGLVPLMTVLVLPGFLRTVTHQDEIRKPLVLCVGLMILAGGGLAVAFGLDKALMRWDEMDKSRFVNDDRYSSAAFCLGELPRAGLTGFGPGSFEAVFLDVGTTNPEKVPGQRWKFAHQDTLQTLLEWGWLGGALWIGLGVGLWGRTYRLVKKLKVPEYSSRYALHAAAFTSLTGVALHAQMDFPLQILGIQVIVAAVAGLGAVAPEGGRRTKKAYGSSRREAGADEGEVNGVSVNVG